VTEEHQPNTPDPAPVLADPSADPTPPRRPLSTGPVQYRGADLEPARGPGLGCFRFQLVVLAIFVVLTPLSVGWRWPTLVSAGLLFAVIVLLLVTGQTIIFLLRLVAADRRGRRRPLASETRTVGELEDAAAAVEAVEAGAPGRAQGAPPDDATPADAPPGADAPRDAPAAEATDGADEAAEREGPMRQ
jgi:hypothetical protein